MTTRKYTDLRSKYNSEYKAYKNAKARCNNKNRDDYQYYGGRGIRFLFKSFEEFFEVLGQRPLNHVLDRIEVNGDYCAENVRWVDLKVSNSNKRIQNRNTLGICGVYKRYTKKETNKSMFVALDTTKDNYKQLYYGDDFFEACCARKSFENETNRVY